MGAEFSFISVTKQARDRAKKYATNQPQIL